MPQQLCVWEPAFGVGDYAESACCPATLLSGFELPDVQKVHTAKAHVQNSGFSLFRQGSRTFIVAAMQSLVGLVRLGGGAALGGGRFCPPVWTVGGCRRVG